MKSVLFALASLAASTTAQLSAGPFEEVAAINNHWVLFAKLPSDSEAAAFAKLGVNRIRTGMDWGLVERSKGVYNWTFYDRLSEHLEAYNVSTLWCVHPQNDLYPGPRVPVDPTAIQAFARFVQALTARYGKRASFWYAELSNEPNLSHNATAKLPQSWSAMAMAAATAVRSDPTSKDAKLAGPAMANAMSSHSFPLINWLSAALNATRAVDLLDLVTIHTYRHEQPEAVAATWNKAAEIVTDAASSPATAPPVASGEWGYTSCQFGTCFHPVSEHTKALYLAREWLVGHALGRPVAVWYDWHEDCTDPTDRECRFGVVTNGDFAPLPAFEAGRAALTALRGKLAVALDLVPVPHANGLQDDFLPSDDDGTHAAAWVVTYADAASYAAPTFAGNGLTAITAAGWDGTADITERFHAASRSVTHVDAVAVWLGVNGNTTASSTTAKVTVSLDPGRTYSVTDAFGASQGTLQGPSAVVDATEAPLYIVGA